MKKGFIVVIHIVFFSSITRGMDDPVLKRNPPKNNDIKLIEELASDAFKVGETVVQIIDEKKDQSSKPRAPIIPPVNISGGSVTETSVMRSSASKRLQSSIENVAGLREHMSTINTQRDTARKAVESSRRNTKKILVDDDAGLDQPLRQKKSFLPKSIAQNVTGQDLSTDAKKKYSADEVWDMVKRWNPTVYAVAQKNHTPLEKLDYYFDCINEGNIRPGAIIEHMNNSDQKLTIWQKIWKILSCGGDVDEQQLEILYQKYEEIEKKNPDDYKAIILELLQSVEKGHDTHSSTIATVHNDLQRQHINDQAAQGNLKNIALVLTTALAIVQMVIPILQANGIISVHNNTK